MVVHTLSFTSFYTSQISNWHFFEFVGLAYMVKRNANSIWRQSSSVILRSPLLQYHKKITVLQICNFCFPVLCN